MPHCRRPRTFGFFAALILVAMAGLALASPSAARRPGGPGTRASLRVQPTPPTQTPAQPQAPTPAAPGDEQIWQDFLAWFKTIPPGPNPLVAYGEELARRQVPKEEIERRTGVIMRFFGTRTDGFEVFYDKSYRRPATGDPQKDGYASAPSAFLIGAVKDLKPGTALDVGMGQGRNAVELARRGWTVTGFDLSGEGVAAATRNAQAAGVRLAAIKSDYASFDFGRQAWDLLVLTFAWAPIDDPAFVERLRASLKPGGLVVFENFVTTPELPYPPMVKALPPGGTRAAFNGFEIVSYEEELGTGDWGGPGSFLVRMVARRSAV